MLWIAIFTLFVFLALSWKAIVKSIYAYDYFQRKKAKDKFKELAMQQDWSPEQLKRWITGIHYGDESIITEVFNLFYALAKELPISTQGYINSILHSDPRISNHFMNHVLASKLYLGTRKT